LADLQTVATSGDTSLLNKYPAEYQKIYAPLIAQAQQQFAQNAWKASQGAVNGVNLPNTNAVPPPIVMPNAQQVQAGIPGMPGQGAQQSQAWLQGFQNVPGNVPLPPTFTPPNDAFSAVPNAQTLLPTPPGGRRGLTMNGANAIQQNIPLPSQPAAGPIMDASNVPPAIGRNLPPMYPNDLPAQGPSQKASDPMTVPQEHVYSPANVALHDAEWQKFIAGKPEMNRPEIKDIFMKTINDRFPTTPTYQMPLKSGGYMTVTADQASHDQNLFETRTPEEKALVDQLTVNKVENSSMIMMDFNDGMGPVPVEAAQAGRMRATLMKVRDERQDVIDKLNAGLTASNAKVEETLAHIAVLEGQLEVQKSQITKNKADAQATTMNAGSNQLRAGAATENAGANVTRANTAAAKVTAKATDKPAFDWPKDTTNPGMPAMPIWTKSGVIDLQGVIEGLASNKAAYDVQTHNHIQPGAVMDEAVKAWRSNYNEPGATMEGLYKLVIGRLNRRFKILSVK